MDYEEVIHLLEAEIAELKTQRVEPPPSTNKVTSFYPRTVNTDEGASPPPSTCGDDVCALVMVEVLSRSLSFPMCVCRGRRRSLLSSY